VLERDWVKVGNQLAGHAAPARTLQGVHQGTVESAAKCAAGRVVQGEGHVGAAAASHAQGLVLSVYHFSGDWSLEDWSAIQGWEVDEWMEHEGDPSTPMGGAAAIQLQVRRKAPMVYALVYDLGFRDAAAIHLRFRPHADNIFDLPSPNKLLACFRDGMLAWMHQIFLGLSTDASDDALAINVHPAVLARRRQRWVAKLVCVAHDRGAWLQSFPTKPRLLNKNYNNTVCTIPTGYRYRYR